MKRIALFLALAAPLAPAFAQTPTTPKPATTAAKPAVAGAKKPTISSAVKLPAGVAPVRGIVRVAFALRYQDYKIGTGALAEPGKIYKVHYTGWLASDGTKFDSSYDHRRPVLDKDGKPENDADGKPKLGDPEPIEFPQGRRGVIPGWDQGFAGMHVGGKRRLFIPYQLAYGELGRPPKIPAKSDLIFDIELLDQKDAPAPPARGMPGMPGGRPMPQRPGGPGGPPSPKPGAPSTAPGTAPGTPGAPGTSVVPPASGKPADPTAPTVAPNSDKPATPPSATTAPAPTSLTAPPAKPANPAQPN